MERKFETKQWSEKLKQAHGDFILWFHGKLDKPPKNPFLPPEIEEGGLVDPYMPEGQGTEIELFNAKKDAEADAKYYSNGDKF